MNFNGSFCVLNTQRMSQLYFSFYACMFAKKPSVLLKNVFCIQSTFLRYEKLLDLSDSNVFVPCRR